MDNIKKAKRLFLLWLITYFMYGIASNVYVQYQKVINRYNPITMLSGYQLVSLGVMLFYFLPLLVYLNSLLKRSEMKRLHKVIHFLLFFIGTWTVLMLIFTILAIIDPNLF